MKKSKEEKRIEDVTERKIQRRSSREVIQTLEAKDIAGYKVQPQTQDEVELWLSEQVWEK